MRAAGRPRRAYGGGRTLAVIVAAFAVPGGPAAECAAGPPVSGAVRPGPGGPAL